jgi:unsaturated rhamnogalacturonyl hydrolase
MRRPLTLLLYLSIISLGYSQKTDWGIKFSDAIVDRYQPTIDVMTHKGWDHSNSIILHGMEKIYAKTNNPIYFNYIKTFVDTFVSPEGLVKGLTPELDRIHPGLLCLFLFEKTGEIKYKTAATQIRNYLIGTTASPSSFNKTPDGGYWHSDNDHYNEVMSVDGTYMAHPFLVKYGKMFDDSVCFDVAAFQTLLVASHSFNIALNLPYHGWDYTKSKPWANVITGTSSQFWSRSTGWYAMALVDILENLPVTHKDYKTILYLFQQMASGIKACQNTSNGLWYQVLNLQNVPGNYPETSASGMIIYSLKKAITHAWLDTSYNMVASMGWKGLQEYFTVYTDGKPQINSFNPGMGFKNSLDDYLAVRPVTCPSAAGVQHPHGYCGVLMAASVMEE